MIVVTGAAGFISSNLVAALNADGCDNLVLSDDFKKENKKGNWAKKQYHTLVDRETLPEWIDTHHDEIEFIVHLGARTDTTEFDWNVFLHLNLHYTEKIWTLCSRHQIPLIYASSAATYGAGELGYRDDHTIVNKLQPLNPYGRSKNEFDIWALQQAEQNLCPPFWAGLKFFNVYGPNEYHKGRMASVVLHTFETVSRTGRMELFRSHRPDYADGMQLRDFVYVKDVVRVIKFLMQRRPQSGLYNVGTGHAQSFLDLANATFLAMNRQPNISFIDIPIDIRDKYQYFTEADISKLRSVGFDSPFFNLQEGIADYVSHYLSTHQYA